MAVVMRWMFFLQCVELFEMGIENVATINIYLILHILLNLRFK